MSCLPSRRDALRNSALGFGFLPLAAAAPPAPKLTDYEAELNDRLGKGVTPERNANVLLWKAIGPTPEGGAGMPAEYFKRLGIPEPSKDGDYFVGFFDYTHHRLKLDQDEQAAVEDQRNRAAKRPWAAKDYPRLAEWLALNEKPLTVVAEASKRPDYYNPLVSRKNDKGEGSLIGVLLPGVQKCREIGAALTARAMLRVSEGKFDDAWADLLTCHRLARLVGRGGTLIESLVGIAVEQITSEAELAYLDRVPLTAKQIQDRLKDLQALPPAASMADGIDRAERYMFLDSLNLIRRGGVGMLDDFYGGKPGKPTAEELKALQSIDWTPVVERANAFYDRTVAALRLKTRAERRAALAKIEADLKTLKRGASDHTAALRDVLLGKDPGKDIAKAIGDILIGLLAPAIGRVGDAYDRIEQVRVNVRVAFALAAYRAGAGRYPARLDDLAPKYLPAVPGDIFSGKPLVYRPDGNGYLLYSVGVNGTDDGGRWFDDDPPGDDPRVRMPLPPLKPAK
jgi:hypothetical protein